jgi:hypothetical protein
MVDPQPVSVALRSAGRAVVARRRTPASVGCQRLSEPIEDVVRVDRWSPVRRPRRSGERVPVSRAERNDPDVVDRERREDRFRCAASCSVRVDRHGPVVVLVDPDAGAGVALVRRAGHHPGQPSAVLVDVSTVCLQSPEDQPHGVVRSDTLAGEAHRRPPIRTRRDGRDTTDGDQRRRHDSRQSTGSRCPHGNGGSRHDAARRALSCGAVSGVGVTVDVDEPPAASSSSRLPSALDSPGAASSPGGPCARFTPTPTRAGPAWRRRTPRSCRP